MSKHRFEIIVTVDDDALADHPGDDRPPPCQIDDWEGRDIVTAFDAELVTDLEVVGYEAVA